jgi:hypothetical protein
MRHSTLACLVGLTGLLALAVGCGRPTLPGQHFSGDKPDTSSSPPITSPLPEEAVLTWGDEEARVRVLAFFPIDDEHKQLMELLQGLVEENPGKLYVRYVDFRLPEGGAIFERSRATGRMIQINGESEVELEAEGRTYKIDLVQEMGRFWTADDLETAITQEIARQY